MPSGKKKILMLTTELGMGGAEKVFFDHLMAFSEAGYEVTGCLYTKTGFDGAWGASARFLELDDIVVNSSLGRLRHRRKRLAAFIRQGGYDLCISHMEGANILSAVTPLGLCRKLMCVHGSVLGDSNKSARMKAVYNKAILPTAYRQADALVAVGRALAAELQGLGLRKAQGIPNFFELAVIQEKSRASLEEFAPVFEMHPFLVHVGRLSHEKNQGLQLHIIAELKRQGRPEKLCLVGNGPFLPQLLAQGAELGLRVWHPASGARLSGDYDVYMTGQQLNPYRFVARSKAFLLTSFSEGFPLVLGEALACGTPAVAVDCTSGPREILSAEGSSPLPRGITAPEDAACGILMPPNVSAATNETRAPLWAGTLTALLNDAPRLDAMRAAGAREVVRYDRGTVLSHWYKLIDSL